MLSRTSIASRIARSTIVAVALLALTAVPAIAQTQGDLIAQRALTYEGHYSTDSGGAWDCSAYVQRVVQEAIGLGLPRQTFDQVNVGVPVAIADRQPGDLIFFRTAGIPNNHVGIITSSTTYIDANYWSSSTSGPLPIKNRVLSQAWSNWTTQVTAIRRVWKQEPVAGGADTDGDSVPDAQDHCPTMPGSPNRAGCPRNRSYGPADFNGDGTADVFYASPADGYWYISDGAAKSWRRTAYAGIPQNQLAFGDFDGDGTADVFWASPADGNWYVSYSASNPWKKMAYGGVPFDQLSLGDFDGDGKADVFWANPSDGYWYVSYGAAASWKRLAYANVPADQLAFGDFDGDRKTDVFFANPADGKWYVSSGANAPWKMMAYGGVPYGQLTLGDFDGDGRSDVFWANPTDGYWYYSSGAATNWKRTAYAGVSLDRLHFADVTGDFRTDVFYASPDGYWYVSSAASNPWTKMGFGGVPFFDLSVGQGIPKRRPDSSQTPATPLPASPVTLDATAPVAPAPAAIRLLGLPTFANLLSKTGARFAFPVRESVTARVELTTLGTKGVIVGASRWTGVSRGTARVAVHLNRTGLRLVRQQRRRALRVHAQVVMRDAAGNEVTAFTTVSFVRARPRST